MAASPARPDWDRLEARAIVALGLRDEPPATVGWPDGARGHLLDVLLLRCRFLAVLEEQLAGFPPEIREAATRRAEESGAEEVLGALRAVAGLFDMPSNTFGRSVAGVRGASPRCLALGQLLGMDPLDPNMRIWAGESAAKVFGL